MAQYHVVDLRSGNVEPEHVVDARSPEEAALLTLGIKGCRAAKIPPGYSARSIAVMTAKPTWSRPTVRSGNMRNLHRLDRIRR